MSSAFDFIDQKVQNTVKGWESGEIATPTHYDGRQYVSQGGNTYDKEAFEKAAEKQRGWWTETGSTHKKYGYDMTNPEDVQRASEGRYSVAYEKSFGDDEYSQWLLANGQASGGYFEKDYADAYNDIMLEKAEKAKVRNFKRAVAQEAWSTASDTMNISGDDLAAAAQRVQIKNPQYAGISIVNTKEYSEQDFSDYVSPMLAEQTAAEKEAEKRATSLYLDEVLSLVGTYQDRQRRDNQKVVEAAEREANEAKNIIDLAIQNSGYSEEIDGRVGLAKDSTLDEWNANKNLKRKAATEAVGAMEVAGMSKDAIKRAIRQDGRLSYVEDSEQGIQDEATRIQRRDTSDAVASDILMREAPIVQASVARAKSVANMGTAAQAGFSPISMMEGHALSDTESAYVEKYMNDTRLALEMSGYDGLEIDNAFRRAGLGEYIPKETARANYAVYTLNEMGCSDEQIEAILGSWDDEDWAAIDKDMSISDYVEDSTIDIAGKAIISVPIRAALSIISGAVGFADMVGGTISGRTETWELTDKINEQAAWWSAYSHDRNHEIISEAADIGSEMLRMYATSMMGTGLAAASTKLMSTAKGTGFLFNFISKNASRFPFVAGAIGNYYTEAMNEGTTARQAAAYAIPAGLLEGYLESLEMGQVMKNTFGTNFVGKKIAASGLSANFKQLAITKGMPFINFALDVIGEGVEESLSAVGSSLLRTATWDEEHQLDMSDVWENAKGGLILGAVMGGLSMPANTQSHKYASEIYKNTGDYSKYIDSLQSAMHIENMDESKRTAILDNVETTEVTDADREAFISATAEIHNLTENIAAKKAAVEAAEQDVAVKVENAEQEVAELKKRISVLQENNGKKKADKIKELAARLNSKQKSLEQIKSEGAKKVETAIADYKAVASKANATIAKNQELIDKYHAAKYTADLEADIESDIETVGNSADETEHMERLSRINALLEEERAKLARLPQQQGKAALRRKEKIAQLEQRLASAMDKYNASVAARTAEPTENTTAPTNAPQNPIDTVKTDVTEVEARRKELQDEIMRKSLLLQDLEYKAEVNETTEYDEQIEVLGIELEELETELEQLDLAAEEQYNNSNKNGGITNGTGETQAGGDAGVSGQTVTVPYSGMAQGLPGMDRRTDYRGIGSPVKDIIQQQGATPVDLRTVADPSSFYAAISEAKQGNPHGAFVTAHDVSEYGDMKMFLSDDNGVGVAVTKDGDIVSVFKNPSISKSRKAVSSILLTAIDNGGVKLDNYNGELSRMYLAHGFIPVARTAFVDEYAPSDWNYERDGRPDIIFWVHNGNDIETVARNIGTQEMPDLKALPLMEYDEAATYRDGLITKNASANPALKDLGANTPTPVEMAQSKVYTNTYDRWLTDAEKLADDTGNAWYARSKEINTLATAKSVVEGSIRRNGNLDSVMAQLQDKNAWDATDVDTAMLVAETLRAEAADTGDYSKLNEWKNIIRQNMTQSGQAIQALAKWTRNSSIAAENALVKAVDKINKDNKKKIASGKAQTVEINPELLNELQAAETAEQREEVVNKITTDIGAKIPVGIIDKINAWRYLAMLGNLRTIFRNLVGNEIMSDVLWVGKDAIGTLLESGLDQSQRTKAIMVGDTYKTNRDYATSTLAEAKNKLEGSSRYDTKRGVEKAIADNTPVFKLKNVEGARKLTNYALSKGDSVFLERQYKRSFAQIMTARGYAPDTITAAQRKECMDYAIAEAQRSTFHDASAVADALSKLENRNVVTKVLVGGVLPFKKTPINVLARGVDFSPIGLIQGTTQYLTKVKSGEMSAAQAVDKISSGLTGSALLALGVFLAKSGIITGGNEDEDKYYMSDLGYQEFALNVGDGKSITIDWAAPATIPLFMGVALNSILEGEVAEGENKLDALINTLSGITDPLVEMSMLQGLQDTLESAAEATKNGESAIWGITKNAAYNYVSSFVPTSFGQIARTIDPVRRDTAGDPTSELGKELDKVTNKMQAKIPGIADNLEPYINIWGEQEINEHSWPVRLLENSILPGHLDETDMTPVDVEITRLYSTTQNPDVIPSNYPYRTLKDYKTKDSYILNNTEFTEFKIENGRAMYAAALDAINSRSYSMMDDDEKVAFISDVIKEAQEDVLAKYKKKYLNK